MTTTRPLPPRRTSRRRAAVASLAALTALALLPAVGGTARAADGQGAVAIPDDPRGLLAEPFVGAPSREAALPSLRIPRHPFMARNDDSNIHNDAYQSDAYARRGPRGVDTTVTSTWFGQEECASQTFDSRGRIVTVCVGLVRPTVRLIDPTTLATIASYPLPNRGSVDTTNFSGGYFYLDQRDRPVVVTSQAHVLVLALEDGAYTVQRDLDLSRAAAGSSVQSVLPDWAGRLWFVTQNGRVGFADARGAVRFLTLKDEVIANSFAIDESGGVFVVSDRALYRFDVRAGRPVTTWRRTYDRGTRVKPSHVSQGSGTTPTLIGSASSPGGGSIAILDNADPKMHLLVFRRGKAGPGRALCRQPVFAAGRSADENSLISVPGGLIAENNYGYKLQALGLRQPDTEPGLVRVDVDYRRGGCSVRWNNTTARIPSSVSKASLATGVVYGYTHPTAAEVPLRTPLPAGQLAPDAWYLTAFSIRTGKALWSRYVGSNSLYNNHYAAIGIGRDGAAYVGTLGGLVRVADGR